MGAVDAGLSHLEPEAFMQAITQRIGRVMAADYTGVLRIGPRGRRLHAIAGAGLGRGVHARGITIPVGWGFAGRVFATGKPQVLQDISPDTVMNPILWEKGIHSMLGVPLLANDGRPIGVLAVGYGKKRAFPPHTTQWLRMLARPLAAMMERLISEERARGDYETARGKQEFMTRVLRMAGHDLKSPLTAIRLQHEVLRRATDAAARQQALEVAQRNTRRLGLLLDDLLDLARLQSGRLVLARAETDLRTVVAEILEAHAEQAHRKGVHLRADLAVPLKAKADARRVGQVLDNLVSNAVRYSDAGATIDVVGWATEDRVGIAVTDMGRGMTRRQLEEAGTPFSGSRATHAGGSGLGLHIAKVIVEEHDGTLRLSSLGPGTGTRAEVILPRRPRPPAAT